MKRYLFVGCIFLFIVSGIGYPNDIENLALKVSGGILNYFDGKYNVKTSIVKFENFSDLSDLAAQKYYQLLVANLETHPQLKYTDLMINFFKKRGEFNLNRIDKLNYLIYIKLIKNRDKLGAGTAIFSRSLDKIVYIKYFEEVFSAGDRDIFETRDYGFKGTGFSRQIEIDTDKNLLDFRSVIYPDGTHRYFFYYPGKIEIFKIEKSHFKKYFSFKLEWGRPYYPVMDYEGRLSLFYLDGENQLYLTVGGNFSPHSKVFCFRDFQWEEIDTINFVPMKLIRLSSIDYLAGARYDEGKNYFKGKLLLIPILSGELQRESLLEKQVPPFYSLDFSTIEQHQHQHQQEVETIHLIDTGYNHRFFAGDFEERIAVREKKKHGSSLAVLNGQWLAVSDYSFADDDTLYFYKIEEGSIRLVYENRINGQVIFISHGTWKTREGFWVYVKKVKKEQVAYSLQFWSKNNDNE